MSILHERIEQLEKDKERLLDLLKEALNRSAHSLDENVPEGKERLYPRIRAAVLEETPDDGRCLICGKAWYTAHSEEERRACDKAL